MGKELPVYCIETFNKEHIHNHGFDIIVLEELVHEFEFTNAPHRHDFYDILFITEGTGTHTIDFVTYEVKPCSIFFLTPGQVHSWDLSSDIKGYTIFFTPEFYLMDCNKKKLLDFPFFHSINNRPCLYLDCLVDPVIKQTISEIFNENKQTELGRDNIVRAYLDVLLTKLSRHYFDNTNLEKSNKITYRVRELESLIDGNFREIRSVKEYASRMNISAKHLNDICKKALNKTVSNLIQERVMLEAKRLLLHSDLTVSQIADQLKFFDKSHFVRFFKKQANQSPELFRRDFSIVPQ